MDYFSPGLRELSRKSARQLSRLQLAAERRRLARAETELGLLGWQQAEFDADTQREVDKIQNYEREQSRLTNESAELGRVIRGLLEERDAARKVYEEERRQLEMEKRTLLEPRDRIERQLSVLRRQEPQYERRIPDLDRELREVNKLYAELLSAPSQTPQVRDELLRLRERTVAIPNEKADLRTQHLRVASEIKSLETSLAQDGERIAALEKQLQQLESGFSASDRDRAAEIRNREREKARIEKEIDSLEGAKANPYQQIGRVLADSEVAPMNQPHSLDKVRRHRLGIESLEFKIAQSLQLSAQDDQSLVRVSYMVWAAMTFALMLLVGLLVTAR